MYYKLNHDEKKIIRDKYAMTKRGMALLKLYHRLFIEGIICLAFGIIIQIGVIYDKFPKWYGILTIVLTIMALVFTISQHILKIKEYNKFIEQRKK